MSYARSAPIKRVDLPSDQAYWVDVKTNLTYAELKGYTEYGGDQGPLTIGEKLRLIVTDWNLDDEAGTKLAITAKSLDRLQEDDFLALIDAYNQGQEAQDKKKGSLKPSSPTSTDAKS